ncbi:uncharacterized protein LOC117644046 [Thrips palmi]|uniref:Uncharacterized protein LOC117644046 n=1 Tax=Thrips palmi TaxID=161013 RepID=A0A6P8YH85_THRPL|nr:uncharacterized protein LOC117644046 [Thrips palmi]
MVLLRENTFEAVWCHDQKSSKKQIAQITTDFFYKIDFSVDVVIGETRSLANFWSSERLAKIWSDTINLSDCPQHEGRTWIFMPIRHMDAHQETLRMTAFAYLFSLRYERFLVQ